MAGALQIRSGTKMNIAFESNIGEETRFEYICTFARDIDESAFLVSIPMKGGKPIPMDFTKKIFFRYYVGSEQVIIAGYADDEIKEGIRKYWKIRRVQEQRQFFNRADERYKVALRIEYYQDDWEPNREGIIEKEDGMTLDISAGGTAIFLNKIFEIGETVFIKMPKVGTRDEGVIEEDLVGVVCWLRDAPKGSIYRRVCGVQFRFGEDDSKRHLNDYIGYVKERYRL